MGEFRFVPGEGLYYESLKVAPFDNYVSRVIKVEYVGESTRSETFYEVVALTLDGKALPPIVTKDLNNIRYFQKWPEIPDATITKKERSLLELRLQRSVMSANVVERVVCSKTGFIAHDTPKALVVGDTCFGEIAQEVELAPEMRKYRWRGKPVNTSDYLNIIKDMVRVAPKCSEILTAALLAAAIKPFFLEAGYPLEFCLNVYGKSGTYKTSLVKAIMDITQTPELLVGSILNDSKKALLKKVKDGYGFAILLDDYHPTARDYDMKKQIANMDAVARQMGSDEQTALVIMTSEYIDGCYSLQDRMLQLEMPTVDLSLLSKLQCGNNLIAQLVKDFLKILVENYDEVISFIKQQVEDGKSIHDEVSARLVRNGNYLIVVARLCEKYLLEGENVLTGELTAALQYQADIQKKHLAAVRKYEETTDFISALHEMLVADIWESCNNVKNTYERLNNQIFMKNNNIYMTKNALRYGFKKYYGVQKVDIEKIVKLLHENDILLEEAGAVTKKIGGVRHLCISYPALALYAAAEKGEKYFEQLERLNSMQRK